MRGKLVIVTALGLLPMALLIARTLRPAPGPLASASGISPTMLADRGSAKQNAKLVAVYGQLPLTFEANYGQTDSRVNFLSRGQGYTLFLTSTEAVLTLRNHSVAKPRNPRHEGITPGTSAAKVTPLWMNLVGARPNSLVEGAELLPGKSNYFIGNDPTKWRTNVPTFAKVRYKDVYPGVDLVYYGNQGELEYDFVVAPGADPTKIQLSIDGAEKVEKDAQGDLILHIAGAEVRLWKPTVYQRSGGNRKEIASRYVLNGRRVIGFAVAGHDRNEPLIIDPVLSYSTYLGGNFTDIGNGIAVDAAGSAYVTGSAFSANFPTKNPLQAAPGGGADAFVAKLDSTGSSLVYSTYLGGSGDDSGNGIAVDASGSAYVTGYTTSTNFPTKNPLQAALGPCGLQCHHGGADAFVAKLDSTGSSLVYSTYLGGNGDDSGNGIAVDASGSAFVTGATGSTNFPTKNPLQAALGGGADAFVAKLDSTGSSLVYSTYLGGSGDDSGNGIAVDASGSAFVTGATRSANFPTASPFQGTCGGCGGGQLNAFVSKLNPAGSSMVYSTYLGGSGNGTDGDFGNAIAVDTSGNAYVTGLTSSPNFPLASPIQASLVPQTCFDYYGGTFPCGNTAFVTELNSTGFPLVYSTYLGASGGNFEEGRGIAVDASGNVYVTGSATSNFLLTPGAFQTSPGGNGDAFVAKISPNNAAGFSLSSFSFSFPDEGIGGTTAPQQIALNNTGSATLTIASIVASGDFAETNTCGSSLAGGTNCTINVTFTPTAAGSRSGTITFTDSASSSPQKVTLSGNGIAGLAATLSPANLSFGNQTQGITSAAQSVTLTNTGSATLTINGFSLGGANPSDFTLSSTNCNQGQSLAVGAGCAFNIVFAPQTVGNRSAALQILDNSAQSPRMVPLTGVGIAPPTVALSATSLSFAAEVVGTTSQGQSITLTTSGSGTLANITINASSNFSATNNCGTSIPGGASCSITVTFAPTASGNLTGTLVVASNAANGPQMISLSGLGTDFSISSASSSATIRRGQTASYTLSLAGTAGFNEAVQLTCAGAPQFANCSVSPNSVPLSGTTSASATVVVSAAACSFLPTDPVPPRLPPVRLPGLLASWFALMLTLVVVWRANREEEGLRRRALVALACLLFFAELSMGCGKCQNATPTGNYMLTVSGSAGGMTHSTSLALTVQ